MTLLKINKILGRDRCGQKLLEVFCSEQASSPMTSMPRKMFTDNNPHEVVRHAAPNISGILDRRIRVGGGPSRIGRHVCHVPPS